MIPNYDEFKLHFQSGVHELSYSNTVIKKIEPVHEDRSMQPIPVLEFLKRIKDEPGDDSCDDVSRLII